VRTLRSWSELPAAERSAFVWSVLLLGAFRLELLVLPFRSARATAMWLARHRGSGSLNVTRSGEIVESAARRFPGTTCLPIALAGYVLLGRTGSVPVMRMGVSKEPDGLEAHAWVEVDGSVVVGAAERARFRAIHGGDILSA
jgi:hypothetical protein